MDGCCDHTKFSPDEETFAYVTQLTRDAHTFVYGRKTYELMVPYWPDEAKNNPDDEFAQAFDAIEKIVVFSQSLHSQEGGETKIIHSGIQEEILALKQEKGKKYFNRWCTPCCATGSPGPD